MELNLKTSQIFLKNKESKARIMINEGSSRSSKTYSVSQLFVVKSYESPGVRSIVRKTLPALKSSAYRDFVEILKNGGIYNPRQHNKSDLIFSLGGSEVEFFSVDQWEKVKGRKRKDLFINEGNELSYDDFVQLSLRTTGQIYIDYNPSHDQYHWIETKLKTRDDVEIIHSTYIDNPFLDTTTIKEIERLKDADPNLWRIYGLGQMGILENLVFNHWKLCNTIPEGEKIMGLDFGFNSPTALTEVTINDDDAYWEEKLYETRLTNKDLIDRMDAIGISKSIPIYADSEDPQRIAEIEEAGYNIIPAKKGKDSVKKGLDDIKSRGFYIHKDSVNIQKEVRSYKYMVKNGQVSEEPVKFNDHILDAGRYAIHTHLHDRSFIGFA